MTAEATSASAPSHANIPDVLTIAPYPNHPQVRECRQYLLGSDEPGNFPCMALPIERMQTVPRFDPRKEFDPQTDIPDVGKGIKAYVTPIVISPQGQPAGLLPPLAIGNGQEMPTAYLRGLRQNPSALATPVTRPTFRTLEHIYDALTEQLEHPSAVVGPRTIAEADPPKECVTYPLDSPGIEIAAITFNHETRSTQAEHIPAHLPAEAVLSQGNRRHLGWLIATRGGVIVAPAAGDTAGSAEESIALMVSTQDEAHLELRQLPVDALHRIAAASTSSGAASLFEASAAPAPTVRRDAAAAQAQPRQNAPIAAHRPSPATADGPVAAPSDIAPSASAPATTESINESHETADISPVVETTTPLEAPNEHDNATDIPEAAFDTDVQFGGAAEWRNLSSWGVEPDSRRLTAVPSITSKRSNS